jgi:hypothetical protein
MKFTYSITLADLQNAQELHWHQTLRRRVVYYSTYWLIPVLLSTLVIMLLSRVGLFFRSLPIMYTFALGFVISAVITTLRFPSQKSKLYRKRFNKKFPPNKRAAWCAINDDGITSAIVGTDEEKWSWGDFVHFAQNDKVTLLYLSEKKFMFMPTNALSVDQRAEILGYVHRYLRKGLPS